MSLSETGFTVQRATNSAFTAGVRNLTANANPGWNNTVTYVDTSAVKGTSYYYRVQSFKPDADYWSPLIGTAGTPIPLPNLVSGWSNSATLTVSPILQRGLQIEARNGSCEISRARERWSTNRRRK